MKKIVAFMHVSLDGFVGGPNGEMDWIRVDDKIFDEAGHETDNADMALYGRVTYDMMESYWPHAANQPSASKHDIQHAAWYNQVDKIVVSKTLKGRQIKGVIIVSENIAEKIQQLKEGEGKNILLLGSPSVAHILIEQNLIDEYRLFINPIVLGKGIPLFPGKSLKLKLISARPYPGGVVCLHYEKA